MTKEERFVEYLRDNEEPCKVAARLHREDVDLRRVFVELTVYLEGRSVVRERQKRSKEYLKIVNKSVRDYGVSPAVAEWLRARGELAHATSGLARVHNVDSLGALHIYLEWKTGRKVTMSELAYLLDAANWALGRKPLVSDPKNLQHELRRWRKNHPRFVKILAADIQSKPHLVLYPFQQSQGLSCPRATMSPYDTRIDLGEQKNRR
jgi:hypothetical protein